MRQDNCKPAAVTGLHTTGDVNDISRSVSKIKITGPGVAWVGFYSYRKRWSSEPMALSAGMPVTLMCLSTGCETSTLHEVLHLLALQS